MPRVRIGPALPDREQLDVEITRLRDLDVGELRNRWHAVFGRPAQAPGTGGFLWPYSFTDPVSQNPALPTLKFPPTGLLPLESSPRKDLWFLRPKNAKLFFFSKP